MKDAFPFRYPRDCPPMTYDSLSAYLRETGHLEAPIGTTVRIRHVVTGVSVRLYDTLIARIYPSRVTFVDDDPHRATTYWIEKIVRDNGLGLRAGRIRRRKADGPGPDTPRGGQAGLLCIDYERGKPVFGRAWPVTYTQDKQEVTAP